MIGILPIHPTCVNAFLAATSIFSSFSLCRNNRFRSICPEYSGCCSYNVSSTFFHASAPGCGRSSSKFAATLSRRVMSFSSFKTSFPFCWRDMILNLSLDYFLCLAYSQLQCSIFGLQVAWFSALFHSIF